MRFQSVLVALVVAASAAIASPYVKRDGGAVLADVNAFGPAFDKFGNACAAFPSAGGTVAQANTIMGTVQVLNTAIKKATTDANRSPPYSQAESVAIVNTTRNLEGKFTDGLSKLKAKRAALVVLPGIQPLVVNGLSSLKNATIAFWAAFLPKSSSDQISSAEGTFGFYVGGYDDAIKFINN
ncbi:hypothetical protein BD410DRAFT_844553 [Rickenella mellea]|uniref:Hydrophobic surface binding protein n=1 Tax=Rickenella mellea TaxID=50990 RepID=A0A4Y7PLK6_9AGAM|nr:hypothetical protein BD410DRAFT_844553 [Rickenella mellea]